MKISGGPMFIGPHIQVPQQCSSEQSRKSNYSIKIMDNNDVNISVIPGNEAIEKVLGPTASILGEDLKTLYCKGRDKILAFAAKKTKDLNDGSRSNLRVTRDIFFNGSFSDEDICAEYFGGILSSSRSKDGKDDTGVYYTDLIKSLSSSQLLAHYLIYKSLNELFLNSPTKQSLSCGSQQDLSNARMYIFTSEFVSKLGKNLKLGTDLFALDSKGLLSEFETKNYTLDDKRNVSYLQILPSPLGIQLYSVANNRLEDWLKFPLVNLGEFDSVKSLEYFSFDLTELLKKAKLTE